MNSIKVVKTKKGFDELKKLTGQTPPVALNNLSAAELAELTAIVARSEQSHQAAMEAAEDNIIQMAPRMLQGAVRRLLGVQS